MDVCCQEAKLILWMDALVYATNLLDLFLSLKLLMINDTLHRENVTGNFSAIKISFVLC